MNDTSQGMGRLALIVCPPLATVGWHSLLTGVLLVGLVAFAIGVLVGAWVQMIMATQATGQIATRYQTELLRLHRQLREQHEYGRDE